MGWRDGLRQASYRGVPFLVRSHDAVFSRRYVSHVLPQRDVPLVEDLGAAPNRWSIDAYVLGEDYMAQRDRLVTACHDPLPRPDFGATLVHPYFGTRQVVCLECRVRESTDEGRMARIALLFTQAGRQALPIEQPLGEVEATRAADELEEQASELAVEELERSGDSYLVPEHVREAAPAEAVTVAQAIRDLDVFSGPAREVAALERQLTSLIADASSLATAPADLVAQVLGAIRLVGNATRNGVAALEAYHALALIEPSLGQGVTSASATANRNRALIAGLAAKAAAAEAVRVAAGIAWPSLDEALEARDRLLEVIDALLDDGEEVTFPGLSRLRSAAVYGIPPDASKLSRLEQFDVVRSLPSLALAYRFSGNVDAEQDLLDRNRIRNPALPPTGAMQVKRGPGA